MASEVFCNYLTRLGNYPLHISMSHDATFYEFFPNWEINAMTKKAGGENPYDQKMSFFDV